MLASCMLHVNAHYVCGKFALGIGEMDGLVDRDVTAAVCTVPHLQRYCPQGGTIGPA